MRKRTSEGARTYRSSSLKRKSQSLLDEQGIHLLEVGITKNGGNSPIGKLRMRKQRVLIPLNTKTTPSYVFWNWRRELGTLRRRTSDRNRKNLQRGLRRPPRRISSTNSRQRRRRDPTFKVLPRVGGNP